MQYEWDEEKNLFNQRKHQGITFELAAEAFEDPDIVLTKDRLVGGEQRWHALGVVREKGNPVLLLVVHTQREENNGEEIVRIISAREAEKNEFRRYRRQGTHGS